VSAGRGAGPASGGASPAFVAPPSALAPRALERLAALLGEGGVSTADGDRLASGRDAWPLGHIRARAGRPATPADAVCWPRSTDEVAAVVRLANEEGFALVPLGAGSGVCGGTAAVRGGVALDLKRMDRLVRVRDETLLCEAEAGINGQRLEDALNRRGYTLGHFPSSIFCSTLGGWLAARSAGQASTKYGKIEDLCAGLEAVLPTGAVAVAKPVPRAAAGPDWRQVLIGSEGTLGVITRAWLRVSPLPEARRFLCYRFPSVEAGLGTIRRVLRRGLRPAGVRLYDPLDTLVGVSGGGGAKGAIAEAAHAIFERAKRLLLEHPDWSPLVEGFAGGCHGVFVCEGDRDLVDLEARAIAAEAAGARAEDRGPAPAERWMAHRYDVSYKGAPLFREGAFVDTMELAAPWDRIADVYARVRGAISHLAVTLAHFSHAYSDGVSVYFTFAAAVDGDDATEARYHAIWNAGLAAALDAGACVSHHHGVGLLKAPFLPRELGGFHEALVAVKRALDPKNVMNPGKLGLP
jgi:alkyldihydroxyacetonephosphate synthase